MLARSVVLGSAHRLSGAHKPHNSLYVLSDAGKIVERCDKRFCSGPVDEQSGDLAHYSPGNHFTVSTSTESATARSSATTIATPSRTAGT